MLSLRQRIKILKSSKKRILPQKVKPMKIHLAVGFLLLSANLNACQTATSPPVSSAPESSTAIATRSFKTLKVGKAPHGMAANDAFVYNANSGEGSVSVIDTTTDTVVKTLDLGGNTPGYIKVSHDGKYMLVLSKNADEEGQLHIFEPAQAHRLVQTLAVGKGPDKIQISDNDQTVYVSLAGEPGIAHYAFAEGLGSPPLARQLIAAGSGSADGHGHRALAAQSGWLLTPNPGDNSVSLVNPDGEHRILRDGNSPGPVALASHNGILAQAIVGNTASHTLSLFDPRSETVVTLSEVGQSPTDIALVPELGRAYVTMAGSNQVTVVDYLSAKKIGTVNTQQRPVHIYTAPPRIDSTAALSIQHEGHDHGAVTEIWVGNDSGDSVTVFDAQTLAIIAHHPTGKGHHKMAFSQNKAYISNITDGTLTVIPR